MGMRPRWVHVTIGTGQVRIKGIANHRWISHAGQMDFVAYHWVREPKNQSPHARLQVLAAASGGAQRRNPIAGRSERRTLQAVSAFFFGGWQMAGKAVLKSGIGPHSDPGTWEIAYRRDAHEFFL